ncbi:hypothetical protein HOU71_gp54 [Pectobacterium phage Clickz]|uniref:Uncharacterized protein n=2 Tax=Phimunavirus Clickz TaxID=2733338 RepID=A0A3G8FH69_9CAUD|nr:hypothetical protein HOU71_gp54 [Pectobacterium phage Clickz]AZF94096.1 hypothetical protein [Pectobacterium phage Clickz]AZF94154.1 hypothetical protein [Pectobacterium phage Clickz_B3]
MRERTEWSVPISPQRGDRHTHDTLDATRSAHAHTHTPAQAHTHTHTRTPMGARGAD